MLGVLSRCLCCHAEGECAYSIERARSRPKRLGWINRHHVLNARTRRPVPNRIGGARKALTVGPPAEALRAPPSTLYRAHAFALRVTSRHCFETRLDGSHADAAVTVSMCCHAAYAVTTCTHPFWV